MLTSVTISIALTILWGLTYIWGRRHAFLSRVYLDALERSRGDVARTQRSLDQWHAKAAQLQAIVDRVED